MLAKLYTSKLTMHFFLALAATNVVAMLHYPLGPQFAVSALVFFVNLWVASRVHRYSDNAAKIRKATNGEIPEEVIRQAAIQLPKGANLGGVIVEDQDAGTRTTYEASDLPDDMKRELREHVSKSPKRRHGISPHDESRSASSGQRMRRRMIKSGKNEKKKRYISRKPFR